MKDYFNELVTVKRRDIFAWLAADLILVIWGIVNLVNWFKDTKEERQRKKLERKYSCMTLNDTTE